MLTLGDGSLYHFQFVLHTYLHASEKKFLESINLWWYLILIPAFKRQRQVDLCEFQATLAYIGSYRIAKATS